MINLNTIISTLKAILSIGDKHDKKEPKLEQNDDELNDVLTSLNMLKSIQEQEKMLGEPDEIETEDLGDGFVSVTKIWKKESGNLKITTIQPMYDDFEQVIEANEPIDEYTDIEILNNLLTKAVKEEDYSEAAKIRDLINKKK